MKTPCPPECPGRNDHCHAVCSTYLATYQENMRRYDEKAKNRAVSDVLTVGIRTRMKKMHRKLTEI